MQDAFEDHMDAIARELGGDWYDGKVVGVTHPNADGSDRQVLIAGLQEYDELDLRPEPDNEFDPKAVAVYTAEGKQVGYLDRRLAGEFTRRLARGVKFRCVIRAVRKGRETCGLSFALAESRQA